MTTATHSARTQCKVQFLDGSTVLATVTGGPTNLGYFYDAKGKNWSAAAWPGSNLSQQVTLAGSLLTVVVGTGKATGDNTPVAFLGVAQVSGSPNLCHLGFAVFPHHSARQPGDFDDHNHHQRGLQQRYQPVGFWCAVWNYCQL